MNIFKMRREEDILSYHDQHEGVKMNKEGLVKQPNPAEILAGLLR